MALSHCWGKKLDARLLRENYNSYLNDISVHILPLVFRDAFQIAGRAGINYLWIDSLWIVQDSSNQEDWKREAQNMASVYKHAFCTIAATGFENGDNGLFVSRNTELLQPIGINIERDIESPNGDMEDTLAGRCLLVDRRSWQNGVDFAPLNTRGWVVQERLLPPRSLHFGSEQLF
ncbi:heterokaryon incompatibility [Lophiotrema nucula]|uniref:Heterokaryon incompatibility n=1 Tax=Lophiotrema nucula TaxID=690887 RepID=A0A6A5YJS6_9PLEO|nr:heterokaryon incompatibility [Lophiotrema nucula]